MVNAGRERNVRAWATREWEETRIRRNCVRVLQLSSVDKRGVRVKLSYCCSRHDTV